MTDQIVSVDSNNEIEPWFQREFLVYISEHLKAVRRILRSHVGLAGNRLGVEPRDEAVECSEHGSSVKKRQ